MGGTAGPSLAWYIARGSGIVAYLLLTASVVLGIALSRRWYSQRLPRLAVDGLHRWLTLTFYAFVVVHVVTLLLDPFVGFHLRDALIPFVTSYRTVWTSLGIIAAELGLAIGASVWIRKWIGYRAWHVLHGLAYVIFPLSLVHGIATGTDTRTPWGVLLYAGSALAVITAISWRTATEPRWRGPALAACAFGAVVLVIWSLGGPLAPGWAAAAGTPKTLLAAAQKQRGGAATPVATPSTPTLPSTLQDTISGQVVSGDQRQVLLRGTGTGSMPLDIAIQIQQFRFEVQGQVQMRTANHTPLCAGPIIRAQDATIEATCSGYGQQINLQITFDELDSGGFSGSLTATGQAQ